MTTKFQLKVYKEVKKIPIGKTSTYKIMARKLKTSPRAIGQALARNKNKDVPCHRIIMASGEIGGYQGRRDNKEKIKLLKAEKAIQNLL